MIDMNGPDIESSRVSGRSEGTNFGICQYVEELQEDGAVKGQSRDPCTQKLNREDYGVEKYWVLLAVVKE